MKLNSINLINFKTKYTDSAVAKKNTLGKTQQNCTPINLNYHPNFCANKETISYKIFDYEQQETIRQTKVNLEDAIKNKDYEKILKYFGIKVEKDEKGMMTLSHFNEPTFKNMFSENINFTFEDIGINEDDMFKNIKIIKENADFRKSTLKDLGNLIVIGGNAYFSNNKISNLGKLKNIGGNANFENSQVTDLKNLETIGGDAYFVNSNVVNLGNLKTIGKDAYFRDSKITDLRNLETIGGNAIFSYSQIVSLGNLKTIGGNADFTYSKVIDLRNLETIDGKAFKKGSKLTDADLKKFNCKNHKLYKG